MYNIRVFYTTHLCMPGPSRNLAKTRSLFKRHGGMLRTSEAVRPRGPSSHALRTARFRGTSLRWLGTLPAGKSSSSHASRVGDRSFPHSAGRDLSDLRPRTSRAHYADTAQRGHCTPQSCSGAQGPRCTHSSLLVCEAGIRCGSRYDHDRSGSGQNLFHGKDDCRLLQISQ